MEIENSKVNSLERKWLPSFSLMIGVVLLVIKFYAYHVTGSQSIFSDALESIVNVVAGIITLIVIVIAARPADADHPYGHGKIESMAATFEGGAITLAGILIIIQSVQMFFHGVTIQEVEMGLYLTVVAGLINGAVGALLHRTGNKQHSEALKSSGAHLLSDALTSVGVLISLFLVKYTGLSWIDPVVAGGFGVILCYSGGKILIRSGNTLLDAQDLHTLKMIGALFEKNYRPGVIDIHHTRVIRSGPFHHIDCHMVIPEFWTVAEAHTFSDQFEHAIVKDYPIQAETHIHLDPCRKVYCENCEIVICPVRQKSFQKRFRLDDLDEMMSPVESR